MMNIQSIRPSTTSIENANTSKPSEVQAPFDASAPQANAPAENTPPSRRYESEQYRNLLKSAGLLDQPPQKQIAAFAADEINRAFPSMIGTGCGVQGAMNGAICTFVNGHLCEHPAFAALGAALLARLHRDCNISHR